MTLVPLYDVTQQFNNKNGAILVAGKLYVYYVGRTELATTWADDEAAAQNTNPVLLDNNGRAPVFVDDSYSYTLVVCDRNGAELFSQDITPGGAGSVGGRIVYHDETLSGAGTVSSLLGVVNIPLGVDETMTAYTGVAEGRDALILGVNGDWFGETFSSYYDNKVDTSAFEECCTAVKGGLATKLDASAINNYYTKNEFDERTTSFVNYNFLSGNYYSKNETSSREELYSAFANVTGGSGGDIWITGAKVIAPDTIDLLPGVTAQSLSSFTVSGDKNHCIAVKGGIYRVPDINQWVSAISSTNYFTTQNEFYSSAYMLSGAIDYVSAHAGDEFPASANEAISAYQLLSGDYYTTADANTMSSMFSGAIDYVSANVGGGANLVSPKNTLIINTNSAEASISGIYPAHNEQTTSSFSADFTIDAWNRDYNFASATSVKFDIKNNNQYVSALMGYKVYENDTLVSSGNNVTAINITTSYAEPTDFELLIEPAAMTQVSFYASADYYKVIPEQVVNLYDVPPYTQSAIDSKSQIGIILTANLTGYSEVYNPAKDSKLIISGELFYPKKGKKVNIQFDKNGTISSFEAGYLVPTVPTGYNNQILSNSDKTPHWISIDSITSGAGSAQINYLSGAIDYLSGCEDNTSGGVDYISAAVDYMSANYVDRTYTGVAPIQVNNSTKEIGITGESLSAGPGIDIFASGGYVVISGDGLVDRFPMSSNTYNCNYTLDVKSSAIYITTATGAAGATTTFNVRGVRYDAFPSTDVSASWFDIINAGNKKCNVYCVQFSNAMTAIDLANYSAYDKVTVAHSNDYTPNCHLYWKSYTKVCPSGFWCELIKGKDEQNNTEWYFSNSGWLNNYEWDWD